MKHAILEVTPEFLIELCKHGDGQPRFVEVVSNPLPDDATFVAAQHDPRRHLLLYILHSESFVETPAGYLLPVLPTPIFRRVTPEDTP